MPNNSLQPPSDLSRVESYQFPAEHVGHLGPDHARALEQFKQLCQSKGYFRPGGAGSEPSHDDETLLRYLRARKWVPNDAFVQFKDTEDWRKTNQLDKLYDTIDVNDYDQARRLYPQWTGRRDRRGIPLYVFEVAHLNSKTVGEYEHATTKSGVVTSTKVPPKMMRLFALYENLTGFVLPLCSNLPDRMYPETPVSQSSNIVDISNVGLKQFWNLKAHMQDASVLATAHYPETLDRIFIIGAPSFFPTVWGWIKRWFDPITVSKIFILSKHDMLSTFEEFIEPENIPKKYGGKLDYEFGQLPNLEPAIEKTLTWSNPQQVKGRPTFPTGPMRWKKTAAGDLVATAVGTEGGRPRDTPVASLRAGPKATPQTTLTTGEQSRRLALSRTRSGIDTHPPTPPPEEVDIDTPPADEYHFASTAAAVVPSDTRNTSAAAMPASTNFEPVAIDVPYRPGENSAFQSMPREETLSTSHGQQDGTLGQGQHTQSTPASYGQQDVTLGQRQQMQGIPEVRTNDNTTQSPTREGTSSTRFEQQDATHGQGQLAHGTPDMRTSGDGDKHGVMEPNTVAQAPKEHPMPEPEVPQPSYLDQAKGLADQAYAGAAGAAGAALKAVGLTKEGEQAEDSAAQEEQAVPEDPRVDQAPEKNVEEYLRSRYASEASQKADAKRKQ